MMSKTAIYVHIPFCKKRCSYCAFLSSCDFSLVEPYFSKLCNEIECYAKQFSSKQIDTIYLGGGTPSSVGVKYINQVFDTIAKHFSIEKNAEITVECNPESLNREFAQALKANNVNRASLGLQSTNDDTLKRIGRLHSFAEFLKSLDVLGKVGVSNINADLIIGLPESFDSFVSSIKTVCQLPVKHISMYALEVHEGTKLFDDVKSGSQKIVYDDDTLCDWYDEAKAVLKSEGFLRYEVSNFCKEGFASKHNLHYWKCDEYFGFGAGAHGFLSGKRFENQRSVADYINCGQTVLKSQSLTDCDKMNEFVMLGLRLENGVNINEFENRFGLDFLENFPSVNKMIDKGFLVRQENNIFVAEDKFYVLNSILNVILS